jgi:hypothetical protein
MSDEMKPEESEVEERETDPATREIKKEVSRSVKFLNYAKACGAFVAALSGVTAFVISLWSQQNPAEPVARSGYTVTRITVEKVSQDLQKEHDERVQQLTRLQEDVQATREELRMVLLVFSTHLAAHGRPVGAGGSSAPIPSRPIVEDQDARRLVTKALAELQKRKEHQEKGEQKLQGEQRRPPLRKMPPVDSF